MIAEVLEGLGIGEGPHVRHGSVVDDFTHGEFDELATAGARQFGYGADPSGTCLGLALTYAARRRAMSASSRTACSAS